MDVKVFGDNLDALDGVGDQIVAALGKEKGVVDLQFKRQSGTPTISVQLLPRALAETGLKSQEVLEAVETAYAGANVGQTFAGTRIVGAVLMLPEDLRHRPEQLGQLMVSSPLGAVPLSQVARVTLGADRYSIEHDGGQRRISITFNVNGRTLQDAVNEARRTDFR